MRALINGLPEDALNLADRAIHYGDGVFETIAVKDGKPCLWLLHMQRLAAGCLRLGITMPDESQLAAELGQLFAECQRGVLKIIITRGAGGRGYRPDPLLVLNRILIRHDWPSYPQKYYDEGITLQVCQTRLGHQPRLAGIKHLNRLEQVLARSEWDDPAIAEGLMLDYQDWVIEGTMSNLFLVMHEKLVTPIIENCGIRGVMRQHVLSTARQLGWEAEEQRVSLEDLRQADAIFVTNSIIGAWPVREIIGLAKYEPGQISHRLREITLI